MAGAVPAYSPGVSWPCLLVTVELVLFTATEERPMSTQFQAIRRKPALLAISALAICGAMFASGALVAHGSAGEPSLPAPTPAAAAHVVAPGIAVDGSANTALQGAPDVAGSKGGGTGSAPAGPPSTAYGPGGCPAPIGDVISGSTIDPAKVGLTPVLLAAGFQLESVSLHADGPAAQTRRHQRNQRSIRPGCIPRAARR